MFFAFIAPIVQGAVLRAFAGSVARVGMQNMLRTLGRIAITSGKDHVIRISISHNVADTSRWVSDHAKQVRFATAQALTRTTKRLQTIMEGEVAGVFDRPTRFVVRGFGTTMATKVNLQSTLFIKDRQAVILKPHIIGGRRPQKPFERKLASEANADGYWTPGQGIQLNAAGNLTMAQIRKIAEGVRKTGRYAEVFVGVPRGHHGAPFGIWGRTKPSRKDRGGIKPLLVKVAPPTYRRRFDFHGIAARHAQRIFDEEFSRAYSAAVRSIRPISPTLTQSWQKVIRI